MVRPSLASIALPVMAGVLVACALVVSPPEGGSRCVLAARDSDCAACLALRCQRELDTCCDGRSCGGVIDAVERCASAHDDTCNAIAPRASASNGGEAALAACLSNACAGLCNTRKGESKTDCRESRYGAATCSCAYASTTKTELECSERAYRGTRCCAAPGWPGPALQCSCRPLVCDTTPEGCSCYLNEYATNGQATRCGGNGLTCCVQGESCHCRPRACGPGERQVDACSADVVTCTTPMVPTDTCSVRE